MVRIIHKDCAEIEREDRMHRLEKIARGIFPFSIIQTLGSDYLSVRNPIYALSNKRVISVHLGIEGDRIDIRHPASLNKGLKLAQAFENAEEGEFTVKRDYTIKDDCLPTGGYET